MGQSQIYQLPGLNRTVLDEVQQYAGDDVADRLFGKELSNSEQMGVHQVWFGDARLLWVPMRTISTHGKDVFLWISCPSLLRDHALITRQPFSSFPNHAVGDRAGSYSVADAQVEVKALNAEQQQAIALAGQWSADLGDETKRTWETSRIILPDSDFQVLMEHALWTQVRNKIQESGGAEVFWTDVCIPRDTILYYSWGYSLHKTHPVTDTDHATMKDILMGLVQVGGQANVGRGWTQSWIAKTDAPQVQNSSVAVEA
jgi:CRISPR-associated protein Cmr4